MRLNVVPPGEWGENPTFYEGQTGVEAAYVWYPSYEWFVDVYTAKDKLEVVVCSGNPEKGTSVRASAEADDYEEAEDMVKMAMAYYPEGYET